MGSLILCHKNGPKDLRDIQGAHADLYNRRIVLLHLQ